ncbi:MAG TPA: GAF domain-containing SpoIIE family protein phosphatase [Candidatus Krumholzibacteria bacterium]|nr:GAF domain-containing SpoIIE family protein phosphatase [Candidatus Krumholzibacteria bacterium]
MTKKSFRLPFGRAEEETGDELSLLREENRQLKRAVEELSILNDLSRAIGASVDSKDIIHKIVDRSMRAVQAEQTVVTLVDRNAHQSMKTLVRAMTSSTEHPHYHLNENLLGWMHLYKRPLLTNDPTTDDRFRGLKWDQTIQSILCVPLMVKSELIGVITSYNKKGSGGFSEEDQRLLAIIAGQSAQIIENARLYEEEKALTSMKEQIKLAAQIQQDLLPKSPPRLDGYDIAACSIAAQMVGGDYYDFIRIPDGRWAVCLGDVSGKGLPASLLMANLQATLRGQSVLDRSVAATIASSNRLIFQSTDPEKFATLFYAVLDVTTGAISFCNAGHEYPMLFTSRGESPTRLITGGMALGVIEEFPYEEAAARMEAGDTLIVYSDGIPDAVNEFDQPFGEDRLKECVTEFAGDTAAGLMARVVDAVKKHEGGTPRIDDLTLLVIKRTR